MEHFCHIKDKLGKTLRRPQDITERWREHFEEISSSINSATAILAVDPVEGPVPPITPEEVWLAVTKTKNGKATGLDDIPSEFWRECGQRGASWLSDLFNQVIKAKSMP